MAAVRTAKKLLLGKEIEHMIKQSGLTQAEAAETIETSQSRIAGLIDGKGNITVGDLERLANKLGFRDPGYQATLLELRRDNHKRGFWTTGHNRAYSEDMRLRVDLEKLADRIRLVQSEVIPGLGQCEAYVRAIHEGEPGANGLTVEDRVQARLARQDIYAKANPPDVQMVLSESCLRREWADPPVMREQIEFLIELSQRSHMMIQVLPFKSPAGRRVVLGTSFTLVRVPSPGAAGHLELAYTEGEGQIRYLDDEPALKAHDQAHARLSAAALGFEESREFMRRVAREFGN
jgi:predicted XRE-type DNA-binding protein